MRKAKSAFYDDTGSSVLGTFQAWREFAARAADARQAWLARLATVAQAEVEALLAKIPDARITDVGRRFTAALLAENQRRLLSEG